MTTLGDLSQGELIESLHEGKLSLQVGPYRYCLQTFEKKIVDGLSRLYADFNVSLGGDFSDFHIALRPSGWSQRLRRVVEFYWDGRCPLHIMEVRHSYAFLEWGMNWCVSVGVNEYLKLHAAVLAKNGRCLIMPGLPGAGKSTLCAALTLRGWRLLTDENALIPLNTADVVPLCRPISLKNQSIDIIRDFDPNAIMSAVAEETHKGRVAHLKSDLAAESHDPTPLPAALVVFPEYQADANPGVRPKPKPEAFMFAGLHSFNYKLLGETGFSTMTKLMNSVDCFDIRYSSLEESLAVMDQLEEEYFSL